MRLVSSAENSSRTGARSTATSRTSTTAAATPPASSASAPARATCSRSCRRRRGRAPQPLAPSSRALKRVNGSASHAGRGKGCRRLRRARSGRLPPRAEPRARPRLLQAPHPREADGLQSIGEFAEYDAAVVDGSTGCGASASGRSRARPNPAAGGGRPPTSRRSSTNASLRCTRRPLTKTSPRIETAQRRFLREGNLDLAPAAGLGHLRRPLLDRALAGGEQRGGATAAHASPGQHRERVGGHGAAEVVALRVVPTASRAPRCPPEP